MNKLSILYWSKLKRKASQHKVTKEHIKNLIRDCLAKTAFSFNGVISKQKDGVSTGSSLGPVIANISMTELDRATLESLITFGKINFYVRCVDYTPF